MHFIPLLSHTVKTLLMGRNKIINLSLKCKNSSLIKLDLKWNQIKYLTASGIHQCSTLLILNLFENHITELYKGDFIGLNRLIDLNIRNNPLRILSSDCFNGLSALPSLRINSPYLENIPNCIFTELRSLRELHISGSRINHLSSEMLCTMPLLNVLMLVNNTIKYVQDRAFDGLPHLTRIVTNQPFICCSVKTRVNVICVIEYGNPLECSEKIMNYAMRIGLCTAGISIVIINSFSLLFWLTMKQRKTFLVFITLLNVSDILMGVRFILMFAVPATSHTNISLLVNGLLGK